MSRLVLSVDPALDIPPFQQIVTQLREFIECDELAPGDPLPTVRQLANDLRVAPNTVARAYSDLQEAGWLTSDGRRGTRVASSTPAADIERRADILRGDVMKFMDALKRRGYSAGEIRIALEQAALHL